jgi:hypothetical protein
VKDGAEPAGGADPAESRPARRWGSQCEDCAHVRAIRSGKGSTFLMCRLGIADPTWPKYPPQPVVSCPRFECYVPP